jgi:hypothetical protein
MNWIIAVQTPVLFVHQAEREGPATIAWPTDVMVWNVGLGNSWPSVVNEAALASAAHYALGTFTAAASTRRALLSRIRRIAVAP